MCHQCCSASLFVNDRNLAVALLITHILLFSWYTFITLQVLWLVKSLPVLFYYQQPLDCAHSHQCFKAGTRGASQNHPHANLIIIQTPNPFLLHRKDRSSKWFALSMSHDQSRDCIGYVCNVPKCHFCFRWTLAWVWVLPLEIQKRQKPSLKQYTKISEWTELGFSPLFLSLKESRS